MAYNNNTPLANQRIKDTQQPIRDNFAELDTYTQVNHEPLNSADAGKHKFCTFTNQGAAPAGAGTEYNLYNKVYNGVQALHLRLGAGSEVPFSRVFDAAGTKGWTVLPSGVFMLWFATSVNAGTTTVNYTTLLASFPGFTAAPAGFVSKVSSTTNIGMSTTTTSVIINASAFDSVYVMCIGI